MKYLDNTLKSIVLAGFLVLLGLPIGMVGHPISAHAQGFGENFTIDQSCNGFAGCSELGTTPLTDIDHVIVDYHSVFEQEVSGTPLSGGDDLFFQRGFFSWGTYIDDTNAEVTPNFNQDDYQVYALFDAAGTAELNGLGEIKISYDIFTIDFFMDDSDAAVNLRTELSVSALGTPTSNSVSDLPDVGVVNGDDDTPLATATSLLAGDGLVSADFASVDFRIVWSDFALFALGADFLTDPAPFYQIMNLGNHAEMIFLNSTTTDGAFFAELMGDGELFFGVPNPRTTIPEPSTLGLFGVGLVVFGFAATRRCKRDANQGALA